MPTLTFPYYIQNRLPEKTCQVEPGLFLDCLRGLCEQYPAIKSYLFQDASYQTLVPSTIFYINGQDIRTLEANPFLTNHDKIEIEPAIVGG